MLEEYERILSMPLVRSQPYLFKRQYPSWAAVTKLLRMSELAIRGEKKSQNGLEGIPWANLKARLGQLHQKGDLGAFMDVFGLLIYDIVLFLYIEDHVDLAAIDAFLAKRDRGKNPVAKHLDEAIEKSIRWYLRWNERDDTIIRWGGFPNVPLMGTQGAINYNLKLLLKQASYPMALPLPKKAIIPFFIHDLGVQDNGCLRNIRGVLSERDPSRDLGVAAPHPVTRLGFRTD
ncbi:hypothetical protein CR513_37859, partial [Mucuna pruriens]